MDFAIRIHTMALDLNLNLVMSKGKDAMAWLGLACCCLMVTAGAEIHFQKPLLYNIANNLFFDFLIYDHKQINEFLV